MIIADVSNVHGKETVAGLRVGQRPQDLCKAC